MLQKYYGNNLLHLDHVQHMNHRMQTTQERSEYDSMINSVKFMQ